VSQTYYDGAGEDEAHIIAITTLPRLNHRSKLFRRRPSLKTFSGSIRAPDRFLPRRQTLDSATESFHSNSDPKTLSMDEKLFRNKTASQDAFNPRRRVTSPIPRSSRVMQRRNFSGNRSGSGGM
jgi:meiosis-specific APC/C activator protein AMA1